MAQPSIQNNATRDPAAGKVLVEDVLRLNFIFSAAGAALQLAIPASVEEPIFLDEVIFIVTTAFAGGTPSIDVGDGTTADAYIATADITETSLGDVSRSLTAAQPKADGEYLTAERRVTVTLSASLTAGAGTVLARIFRLA